MIHPKAIYMVEGDPFEVQELHYREDEEKVAYVKRVVVDYFTDAVSAKGVWILQHLSRQDTPGLAAEQGEVLVAEKVVGFKKIKMGTLENVGAGEVELPQQEMQTTSVWLAPDPGLLAEISPSRDELLDGLRALTYLLHHLAPHLPARRHPRPGLLARRRLAVGGRRGGDARVGVGAAAGRRGVHADRSTSTTTSRAASASPSASSRCCPICSRARARRSRAVPAAAGAPRAWGR